MKILHFAHSFFPVYGGTSTRLFNLLSNDKNLHYLYVPYPSSISHVPYIEDERYGNLKIRRFIYPAKRKRKIPGLYKFNQILSFNSISNSLVKLVSEKKIDIVHAHNPLIFALSGMKFAKKYHLPLIYEIHLFDSDVFIKEERNSPLSLLRNLKKNPLVFIEKKLLNISSHIIVQTEMIKDRVVKTFGINSDKIYILPMGINPDLFNPIIWKVEAETYRARYNLKDKVIIMYNGYLKNYNGITLLINAITDLSQTIKKKIKLLIIGRGPLEKEVINFKNKNIDFVEFLGIKRYDEIPLYYEISDIIINPRLNINKVKDNVPTKMLEGMAMEKVVLGSDINSITEIIEDNHNGFLFQNGNKQDLTRKITYLVENIRELHNIRNNARIEILSKFQWSFIKNTLSKIYQELSQTIK